MSNEESKPDVVKEARELLANAAHGPLELIRYNHGGGRLFREDPHDLIADFYDAGNREFYSRAREIVSALCDEVEQLRRDRVFLGDRLEAQAETMSKVVAERNGLRGEIKQRDKELLDAGIEQDLIS